MKGNAVKNQVIPLAALKAHGRNYQRHPDAQIENLQESLRQFGQVRSIVAQANGGKSFTILAGHGLAEAAKREGFKELRVDVVPASWSKAKALAYLAADNELSRSADPDQAQLAAIVKEVMDAEGAALARLAAGEELALQQLLARGTDRIVDDPLAEWQGMPEFEQKDILNGLCCIVRFLSESDMQLFSEKIGQPIKKKGKTSSIWFPAQNLGILDQANKGKFYSDGS